MGLLNNHPKVAQPIFCQNNYTTFTVKISYQKGTRVFFIKLPKINYRKAAKTCPIWSPCHSRSEDRILGYSTDPV
jgi:hypothetical protein